jgi:hypothetical protein
MRITLVLASCLITATAHAESFRTYLASYGNDSNPCTVTAPCRLLPAALAQVADGGDIWMLDSANFNGGTVDIAKSVSIQAIPGQVGSLVAVANAPAVSISTLGVRIRMRNLAFTRNATNGGTYGIEMTGGVSLSVEDSAFTNFTTSAIYAHDFGGRVSIKDSSFTHLDDYAVRAENGPITTIMESKFVGATGGVGAFGTSSTATLTTLIVSDCTFTGSDEAIAVIAQSPQSSVRAFVNHSRIENGGIGIGTFAAGSANAALSDVMIAGNNTGVLQNGGQILSAGNNQIVGNSTNVSGTLTSSPLM